MTDVDFNADAGESFGRWTLGSDAELFPLVTTVNIACGFHAGDSNTMKRAVAGARDAGCSIGAHPGYPDLLGFGRRALAASITTTVNDILYQVGALSAIAAAEQVSLTHVKPHGSLMGRVVRDSELAIAVAEALEQSGLHLPLVMSPGSAYDEVVRAGFRAVPENAADLDFTDDGFNVIEPEPARKGPQKVAQRALMMSGGNVDTVSGKTISMPVKSICIHGDRPNAVEIARAVRNRLNEAGVNVRSLYK